LARSRQSGFTLLEVMISIFILTAIALMFASAIPAAKKSATLNGQYAQATSLCQHKIDQLRAIGPGRMMTFGDLFEAGIIDQTPTAAPYSFVAADSISNYLPNPTATLTIQSVSGEPNALKATVTITWQPAIHQAHSSRMSVTAIITNQGI